MISRCGFVGRFGSVGQASIDPYTPPSEGEGLQFADGSTVQFADDSDAEQGS